MTPPIVIGGYNIAYPGRWIPTFQKKSPLPFYTARQTGLEMYHYLLENGLY